MNLIRPASFIRRYASIKSAFSKCDVCGTVLNGAEVAKSNAAGSANQQTSPFAKVNDRYNLLLNRLDPTSLNQLNSSGEAASGTGSEMKSIIKSAATEEELIGLSESAVNSTEKLEDEWTSATTAREELTALIQKRKQHSKLCTCQRCRDIKLNRCQTVDPVEDNAIFPSSKNPRAFIIDAVDFPTTISSDILSNAKPDDLWVVNKSDLFGGDRRFLKERILPFVRNELKTKYNIDGKQVILTSAKLGWGLEELYQRARATCHFVGAANTGKTSLILALQSKFGNLNGDGKIAHKSKVLYVTGHPWTTRDKMSYRIKDKTFYDNTSLPETGYPIGQLDYSEMRKLSDGKVLLKSHNHYNVRRVTCKPGQVISFGGALAIEYPNVSENEGTVLIAWPVAANDYLKMRTFSSLEKMESIMSTPKDRQQDKDWFYTNRAAKLETHGRYTISGRGLSIAVRGVGSVHFHINGKNDTGKEIIVHALKDATVVPRGNVVEYSRDKTAAELKALKPSYLQAMQIKERKLRLKRNTRARLEALARTEAD